MDKVAIYPRFRENNAPKRFFKEFNIIWSKIKNMNYKSFQNALIHIIVFTKFKSKLKEKFK